MTELIASTLAERLRFNCAQAGAYVGKHPDTVRKAAQAGALHGTQLTTPKGRWSFRRECLDAWADGEQCPHQRAVASVIALAKTG